MKSFTIVAIGASVGGLEAVSTLFRNLPSDTGMAFIYVQHLSPNHKSLLTTILTKITKMKVQEIANFLSAMSVSLNCRAEIKKAYCGI